MPEIFYKCIRDGGRVRTKNLGKGKYILICFPKGGGSSIAGEVRTKKKSIIRHK